MEKRNRRPRSLAPMPESRKWRNVPPQDLFLYARSFHTAAKTLAETPESDSGSSTGLAAWPVIFMYRHALELHLKAIVLGEGGHFLATKPDPLTIHKTHSVSWLAQFVAQIVTALQWEPEFKCAGVENLDDFKATVEEVNSVDPGSYVFRLPFSAQGQDAAPRSVKLTIREFARRMDALLELLDATADALSAEWDRRSGVLDVEWGDGSVGPTIH